MFYVSPDLGKCRVDHLKLGSRESGAGQAAEALLQLSRAGEADDSGAVVGSLQTEEGAGSSAGIASASRSKAASCQASILTNKRLSGRCSACPRPTTGSSSGACHCPSATRVIVTAFSLTPDEKGFVSSASPPGEPRSQALLATPNVSRRTVTG
ncbi:hypothetical protein K7864_34165 [Streptomyces sp. SP2-10]|nr:hypothetical protein [Streptomyces sp. SP2-10]MBY8846221.1 hypothetical protein [Streptomyces sp. SP2-10]